MNIFKSDYWHEEVSVIILSVLMFAIFAWTYMSKKPEMFSYLTHYTTIYVPVMLAFGGLKTYRDKNGK